MNERIRELAEQARKYARDYVAECKHYGYYMEHNEYELRFEGKFAELIVRECIGILMKPEYVMTNPQELSKYNEGWVNGRLLGIEHIKETFGVE